MNRGPNRNGAYRRLWFGFQGKKSTERYPLTIGCATSTSSADRSLPTTRRKAYNQPRP